MKFRECILSITIEYPLDMIFITDSWKNIYVREYELFNGTDHSNTLWVFMK